MKKQPTFDHKNVEFSIIDKPDHPDFDKVYACYKKCFTLATEQESKENFLEILAANGNPRNPGKEMWVYAKDKTTGEVLGAHNFDVFKAAPGHGMDGTVHAIYMFVPEEHREQGMFKMLLEQTERASGDYLRSKDPTVPAMPKITTFAEQNNPLMLTPSEYIEDTKSAIDQNVRRNIWEKLDFKTAEMRYVQPPLEKGGETCDYLDIVARPPQGVTAIPAEVMRKHLENFFEQSLPEGTKVHHNTLIDLQEAQKSVGQITLAPVGKFKGLMSDLNVEKLSSLPASQQDVRIGELRPDLVQQLYGDGVTIDAAMTSATAVRDQKNAAAAPQSPVQQLQDAIASHDVSAMLAALTAGAPPNAAVIRLAATNPQLLAALPQGMAASIAAQSQGAAAARPSAKEIVTNPVVDVSTQTAVKPVAESAKPAPAKSAGTAPRVSGQSALETSMQAALKKVKLKPSPITGGGGSNDNVQLSAQIRTEDGKTIISEGSKRGGRG